MKYVRLLFFIGGLLASINTVAQIAIDTTPDQSATLNIGHKSGVFRGILIPRISNNNISNINSPTRSLLVFDSTKNEILYYDSLSLAPDPDKWVSVNPWKRENSKNLTTTTYDIEIAENIKSSSGTIKSTSNISTTQTISATRYLGYTVPPGGIIMYSGDVNANFTAGVGNAGTPYEGWALCDGNNNTPDLSGKFIVGFQAGNTAYDDIAVNGGGDSGGSETVSLEVTHLPQHKHKAGTLKTTTDGNHTHGVNSILTGAAHHGSGNRPKKISSPTNVTTTTEGAHFHTLTGDTDGGTGGGTAHENRPPYMVLAYIMKLP